MYSSCHSMIQVARCIFSVLNLRLLIAQYIISSHSKSVASWFALSCMALHRSPAHLCLTQDKKYLTGLLQLTVPL